MTVAMFDGRGPQAFISYSRADWRSVQPLVGELRRIGVRTWIDWENIVPGEHWRDAIGHALGSSQALVCCISPLSMEGTWVRREVARAVVHGLKLIPVMVEPVATDQLPEELRELHVYDMSRLPQRQRFRLAAVRIADVMGVAQLGEATARLSRVIKVHLGSDGAGAYVVTLAQDAGGRPMLFGARDLCGFARVLGRWRFDFATRIACTIDAGADRAQAGFLLGALAMQCGDAEVTVTAVAEWRVLAEAIGAAFVEARGCGA